MFSFYYKKSKNKTITLDALLHLLKNKYPTLDLNKSHIYRIIRDNNITLKMTRIRHEPIKHFGKDIDINKNIKKFYDGLTHAELKNNISKVLEKISKEKYRNIFKGAYERPEKYVLNKKTQKSRRIIYNISFKNRRFK